MNRNEMKRLSIWYIIFPISTLIIVFPMISELPPLLIPDNFNILQIIIVVPFYLGILALPGYIYAWNGHYDQSGQPGTVKAWIYASLIVGFLACLGGTIAFATVIAIPSIIGSIIFWFLLLRRYWISGK